MAERERNIDEYRLYKLTPAPPRWSVQEYIDAYLREGDDKYLAWFLHYHERTMNKKVLEYGNRYAMQEHFADLKQGYAEGLLTALKNYDPARGAGFLSYAENYIRDGMLGYVYSGGTGFSMRSRGEFDRLRAVMWEWGELGRDSSGETMGRIAEKLGIPAAEVEQLIRVGCLNENVVDLYRKYGDEDSEMTMEESIADPGSDPARMYARSCLYARLWEAYDGLDYEERSMLAERYGFCMTCGSVFYMDPKDPEADGQPKKKPIPQMLYTDIATEHGYSDGETVKRKCERALGKLQRQMWCASAPEGFL